MVILILLLLMFLGIVGAITIPLILIATRKAKKVAYELLKQEKPNPLLLQKAIKSLSALSMGHDIEGMELVKKLMEKRGA